MGRRRTVVRRRNSAAARPWSRPPSGYAEQQREPPKTTQANCIRRGAKEEPRSEDLGAQESLRLRSRPSAFRKYRPSAARDCAEAGMYGGALARVVRTRDATLGTRT